MCFINDYMNIVKNHKENKDLFIIKSYIFTDDKNDLHYIICLQL